MQNNLFRDTLKNLKAVEEDLLIKLENVRRTIRSFEGNEGTVPEGDASKAHGTTVENAIPYAKKFDANWSLGQKFVFLLKMENRFLHFREAGELIAQLDGEGDPDSLVRKLSSNTLKLKKDGTIVKYKATHQNRDTFWGSPKWLNEDGTIKEGHEYNEKYLISNKEKEQPLFEI